MKPLMGMILGLLTLGHVYGDDAAMRYNLDSGAVLPVFNNEIRMMAEDIEYKDGIFTTKFIFKNETTLKQVAILGFPVFGNIERAGKTRFQAEAKMSQEEEMVKIKELFDFDCSVDGVKLERKLTPADTSSPGSDYKYYYISELGFEPGETKTVVNVFKYEPEKYEDSIMNRSFTIHYILKTGQFWRDSIGSVRIRIVLPVDRASYYFFDNDGAGRLRKFTIEALPASYRIEKDEGNLAIIWNYIYLEPTFDVQVTYGWSDDSTLTSYCSRSQLVQVYNAFIKNGSDNTKGDFVHFFESLKKEFLQDIYVPAIVENIKELLESPKVGDGHESIEPMISFATNAIYALNGYSFPSKSWRKLFKEFDWYRGTTKYPKFNEKYRATLSELETLKAKLTSQPETK